jgi:hypothetical protein
MRCLRGRVWIGRGYRLVWVLLMLVGLGVTVPGQTAGAAPLGRSPRPASAAGGSGAAVEPSAAAAVVGSDVDISVDVVAAGTAVRLLGGVVDATTG